MTSIRYTLLKYQRKVLNSSQNMEFGVISAVLMFFLVFLRVAFFVKYRA